MKLAAIAALFIALIVFTGCVKLDINVKVNSNGTGTMEMLYDLTGIASIGQAQGEDNKFAKENICATITESGKESLVQLGQAEPKCEAIADYKARVHADNVDLVKLDMLKVEDSLFMKKYTLSLKPEEGRGGSMTAEQISQAKAIGVSIRGTVEMPGTIKKTSAGKISEDGKKVSIDFLEEADTFSSGIAVESEELKIAETAIAGAVVIAAIGAMAYFFFLKK